MITPRIHNHPSGLPPSPKDLLQAIQGHVGTDLITTPDGYVYRLDRFADHGFEAFQALDEGVKSAQSIIDSAKKAGHSLTSAQQNQIFWKEAKPRLMRMGIKLTEGRGAIGF